MESNVMVGLVAGAVAPLTMTIGFIVWGDHWHGSAYSLNMFKCTLAGSMFVAMSVSNRNLSISSIIDGLSGNMTHEDATSIAFICFSSLIGIVIGDNTWLMALQKLGARKVILVDTLKPFLAAIFGSFILNEVFNVWIGLGLLMSGCGVLIVCLEKEQASDTTMLASMDSEDGHPFDTTSAPAKSLSVGSEDEESVWRDVGSDFGNEVSNKHPLLSPPGVISKQSTTILGIDADILSGYVLAAINVILDACTYFYFDLKLYIFVF